MLVNLALTVWVGRTLHQNGRRFLVDAFAGDAELADSVNHLLVIGFYLVNAGYVMLALRYGARPFNMQSAIESLSTKVGLVLLVLGGMHFFNLGVLAALRKSSRAPSPRGMASSYESPRNRV